MTAVDEHVHRPRPLTVAVGLAVLVAGATAACSSDADAPPATTVAAAALAGGSLCDDADDEATGPLDLQSVSLVVRDDDLQVAWAVAPTDATGGRTYVVDLGSVDVEVVAPGDGGDPTAQLVVDGGRTYRLEAPEVDADGTRASVRVPRSQLGALAAEWTASVAVDGEVSDTCGPAPLPTDDAETGAGDPATG